MRDAWFEDDFNESLDSAWRFVPSGSGLVRVERSFAHLEIPRAERGTYHNAQIERLSPDGRRNVWRPPLRLQVRARMSRPVQPAHAVDALPGAYLAGTVGFGFWNEPLTLAGGWPRLPDAIWFFGASAPSDMRLVPGMPGRGWKAQLIHSHRWGAVGAGIEAARAIASTWIGGKEDEASRAIQRLTGAQESLVSLNAADWHTYVIEWHVDVVRHVVDDVLYQEARHPPQGPLLFLAWIDNQFATVSPRGSIRFGTVPADSQWMELDNISIVRL